MVMPVSHVQPLRLQIFGANLGQRRGWQNQQLNGRIRNGEQLMGGSHRQEQV